MPGAQRLAAPAHSHDHYEETIYGIDGVLTWTVDGQQIEVRPGQALCIPRGAIHRFDNNELQDAKALCLITPAAIGPQYSREAAEVINAAAGGPPDPKENGGGDAPPRPHASSASVVALALKRAYIGVPVTIETSGCSAPSSPPRARTAHARTSTKVLHQHKIARRIPKIGIQE